MCCLQNDHRKNNIYHNSIFPFSQWTITFILFQHFKNVLHNPFSLRHFLQLSFLPKAHYTSHLHSGRDFYHSFSRCHERYGGKSVIQSVCEEWIRVKNRSIQNRGYGLSARKGNIEKLHVKFEYEGKLFMLKRNISNIFHRKILRFIFIFHIN